MAFSTSHFLSYYKTTSFSSSLPHSSSPYNLVHSVLLEAPAARFRPTLCVNGSSRTSTLTYPLIEEEFECTREVERLQEKMRRTLQRVSDPMEAMKLIDTFQWLGIWHHYGEEIDLWLEKLQYWDAAEDDLHATALRFRLLRQNGKPVNSDIFRKLMVKNQDKEGVLCLYEASYLGTNNEETLSEAMEYAKNELKSSIENNTLPQHLFRRVNRALELPRHMRMETLESRLYIDEYRAQNNHNTLLLEYGIFDYNQVQSQYRTEFAEITRWWQQLGLIENLGFARDRLIECFLWTVGIVPEPKYSGARKEMAKAIALLTVIDDVFDMYGPMNELELFTQAIRRWDLDAIEQLPEYMKICYMALYNTTNEIAFRVLKEQGRNFLPFLAKVWIDTIEAYMTEAKWFDNGNVPHVEDYLKNGVTTSGSYMALVHMFFLMGQGRTTENVNLMVKPYPKLFSNSGTILRLWDDLGTTKEEQDRGDNASIITSLLKDKSIANEGEAKEHVKRHITNLWKDMNEELVGSSVLPLPVIKGCFNMSRTSQVVYQHKEDSYFSSVKKFVDLILFEPISDGFNVTI